MFISKHSDMFLCTQCQHVDDADRNGSINIAHRGVTKLGIESLLVVSQKVTSLEPASQEASGVLSPEPGNPAKLPVKQRQLRLLTVKSVEVTDTPKAKRKRKAQEPKYTQLDLFGDWDVRGTTS